MMEGWTEDGLTSVFLGRSLVTAVKVVSFSVVGLVEVRCS